MVGDGIAKTFVYEGRMNSQKYINVLETVLMPSLTRDTNAGVVKLQQDDAPCYTSVITVR